MTDDELNLALVDRVLRDEVELLPSSGFTASVMDKVRMEASMPAPIAFPWMRFLPGLLALCLTLAWLIEGLARLNWALAEAEVSTVMIPFAEQALCSRFVQNDLGIATGRKAEGYATGHIRLNIACYYISSWTLCGDH